MDLKNILQGLPIGKEKEVFELIAQGENVRIERIVSTGQITPEGEWLQSDKNEFVLLLSGKASLTFEDGVKCDMAMGDHLVISASRKHRVSFTQASPPTVWLVVHFLI